VSGSEAAFVEEMNDYLDSLGATDTTFVTPHGLDATGHAASPVDLAAVGLELLDNRVLASIVATSETTIEGSRGPQFLENRNVLLDSYKGALGIKTGMTSLAGDVLVAAAERRGDLVVAVAMRSLDAAADARELLDYGFERLADEIVVRRGAVVSEVILDPGGTIDVVTSKALSVLPPEGVEVVREVRVLDSFGAGVSRGEHLGTLEIVANGKVLATTPLVAAGEAEPPEDSVLQSLVEGLLSLFYAAGRVVGVE
ncbi:MAG: hypothetical protein M3174_06035, partial [Actinomycetota bacterium]|nr:hypothetical protein [Actinomycetota bacterium]